MSIQGIPEQRPDHSKGASHESVCGRTFQIELRGTKGSVAEDVILEKSGASIISYLYLLPGEHSCSMSGFLNVSTINLRGLSYAL